MKKYGLRDAKAIIGKYCDRSLSVDESGVNLSPSLYEDDQFQGLCWKYVCELDPRDDINLLDAPCLPFLFNANQLAAFMLDGPGAKLPTVYGNWHRTKIDESVLAPDEEMLKDILGGDAARDAREALRLAYASIGDAQAVVGEYPWELQKRADTLADACTDIADQAYKTECDQAKRDYEKSFSEWRKAMVNQLLRSEIAPPIAETAPPEPQAPTVVSTSPATPTTVVLNQTEAVEPSSNGPASLTAPAWSLIPSLKRAPGYRWPLYQFLKAAHAAGKRCPKARDVLEGWRLNTPPELQVMTDGVKYNNALGNPKDANLKAIQQAIKGLLKK